MRNYIPLKGKLPRDKEWQTISYVNFDFSNVMMVGWLLKDREFVIDIDRVEMTTDILDKLGVGLSIQMLANSHGVVKTKRGYHIYCELGDGIEKTALISSRDNVDYVKEGKYVVAEGSVTPMGFRYKYVGEGREPFLISAGSAFHKSILREVRAPAAAHDKVTTDRVEIYLNLIDVKDYAKDYNGWFKIMAATHHTCNGSDNGFEKFFEWCQRGGFKGKGSSMQTVRSKWDSLKGGENVNQATHRTLIAAIPPEEEKRNSVIKWSDDQKPSAQQEVVPVAPLPITTPPTEMIQELIDSGLNSSDKYVEAAEFVMTNEKLALDSSDSLYHFDKIWMPISENYLKSRIMVNLRDYSHKFVSTATAIKTILALIKADESIVISSIIQEATNPYAITFENGTIIRAPDGRRKWHFEPSFNPSNYCTMKLNFNYIPKSSCKLFDKTVKEILRDDAMVQFFLELVGYSLQHIKPLELVVLLHGGGSNGKSLLIRILEKLSGDLSVSTNGRAAGLHTNSASVDTHFEATLVGKRLMLVEDLSVTAKLYDDAIKKYSGAFRMLANPKNKTPFNFVSNLTLFMCCNEFPKLNDMSNALRRRVQAIPFTKTFSGDECDPLLGSRITGSDAEMSGIMAKVLGAHADLVSRKHRFQTPKRSLDAAKAWLSEGNPVFAFVEDRLSKTKGGFVEIRELHRAYTRYITVYNTEGVNTSAKGFRNFNRDIRALGFATIEKREPNRGTYWADLKLKSTEFEDGVFE